MSKIFTWLFGFVTGVIGGLFVLAAAMVERPGDFVHVLLHLASNTEKKKKKRATQRRRVQ